MSMDKNKMRLKRKMRIRKKINGTPERPRLVVFRSNKSIYAQLVDDLAGKTIAAASSIKMTSLTKDVATEVGKEVARKAKELGIEKVVFDRNGYLYHGRVKALADGAREAGLVF
ncbi:50S ribosomal protein L18 [Megalodesulfovibrio paquesii]